MDFNAGQFIKLFLAFLGQLLMCFETWSCPYLSAVLLTKTEVTFLYKLRSNGKVGVALGLQGGLPPVRFRKYAHRAFTVLHNIMSNLFRKTNQYHFVPHKEYQKGPGFIVWLDSYRCRKVRAQV